MRYGLFRKSAGLGFPPSAAFENPNRKEREIMKTAIILARDDKGTEPLYGVPAARRLVVILTRLGFGDIHVVGRVDSLLPILSDLVPERSFHSIATWEALERFAGNLEIPGGEKAMVLRANHVADKNSLAHFLKGADASSSRRMEVTGTRSGKDWIYLVDRGDLAPVLQSLWSESDLGAAAAQGMKEIPSLNGLPCVIEDKSADAALAEEKLLKVLASYTADNDGFMSRHFDRRISQLMSRRLAHTKILPNQITLIGMSIGLIGALFLSFPGYWCKLIGASLFLTCIIVDGVDGEIARLTLKESAFGHYLDVTTDNIVHAAIFAGIAFGLYHDSGNRLYINSLWVLLGGFFLCLIAGYQCILKLDPETLKNSPRILRIMALATSRDFAYLVFLLAIFGRLSWFLLGAAVGSYLFAIGLWVITYQEKRRRSPVPDRPAAA
jgi:phosphatidylglycerophosphate synthase